MNGRDTSPPSHVHTRRVVRHADSDSKKRHRSVNRSTPEDLRHASIGPSSMSTLDTEDMDRSDLTTTTRPPPRRNGGRNAFLLLDPVFDARRPEASLSARGQRRARPTDRHRLNGGSRSPRRPRGARQTSSEKETTDAHTIQSNESRLTGSTMANTALSAGDATTDATAADSPQRASLDMDSAQIVNMALNLSESRRLASRRNVSQPLPPRLAPLPDASTGGSLRQHLQQQRRISRTISPKPGSRQLAGQRLVSPLQAAFEGPADGGFRYQFSQSTLARAQKAKDHLELLGQYRRLGELLPPLRAGEPDKFATSSVPASLMATRSGHVAEQGRPYNPLQYIRNRKVRARERRAIDGEGQGFNDASRVTEWVDEVVKTAATGQTNSNKLLPPYASADDAALQQSPPGAPHTSGNAAKSKRPRSDWVIDPADLIADAYWLEQGDNKKLVEDRQWKRVFPQDTRIPKEAPLPVVPTDRDLTETIIPEYEEGPIAPVSSNALSLPEFHPTKAEHEHIFSGARDRAQQKLRALKGVHHRHNSSVYGRGLVRSSRGSVSESSDTDSDWRSRVRIGPGDANEHMILEKHMLDLIAREQNEQQSQPQPRAEPLPRLQDVGMMTPERERERFSPMPSRRASHSRRQSKAEFSESDGRLFKPSSYPAQPSPGTARTSLEVPQWGRRFSIEDDTSLPTSPELRPSRDSPFMPAIGMDLSPTTSRPSSPSRNPFSKVKSMFRERSRERTADLHAHPKTDLAHAVTADERWLESPDVLTPKGHERRDSRSPNRKGTNNAADVGHKAHRVHTTGHLKKSGDDVHIGLRGFLRGPRIDTVIRSGVSKVGDMIWRRDGDGEHTLSDTSSDESDVDRRGRSRISALPSRTASQRKGHNTASTGHYLDVMPRFKHASEHSKAGSDDQGSLVVPGALPISRTPSRRSARFDLLKPPRLNVQRSSPSVSPPPRGRSVTGPVDSGTESRQSSRSRHSPQVDVRLQAALSGPRRNLSGHSIASRHWSISDREDGASSGNQPVSKFEVARMKTLVLSRGITAMEIDRRVNERKPFFAAPAVLHEPVFPIPDQGRIAAAEAEHKDHKTALKLAHGNTLSWPAILDVCTDGPNKEELSRRPIAQAELYPFAARLLAQSIQSAEHGWHAAADAFVGETCRALQQRVGGVRDKVHELSTLTREAADDADEVSRDVITSQRLEVKRVVDVMDKMLRRRRRRFRWVRRAGWLAVEWVLVGFMWYVWFLVMIARVFLGMGKGLVRGIRWLLWL